MSRELVQRYPDDPVFTKLPDCALAYGDQILSGFVRPIPWGLDQYRAEWRVTKNMKVTHIALRFSDDKPYTFHPLMESLLAKRKDVMNIKFCLS